jgi:hypothetical protein
MTSRLLPLAIGLVVLSAAAGAAPRRATPAPEALEGVLRCRAIADEKARLACYDSNVARFETARANRELVVVDRKQIRETKRSLFGLDLPSLSIFGGGDNDDIEEVNSIEGVVASAYEDGEGRWVVKLQEGGTWRQIDSALLGRNPRAGSKVKITKAAMGSFMMRIDNQPGIRARRVN